MTFSVLISEDNIAYEFFTEGYATKEEFMRTLIADFGSGQYAATRRARFVHNNNIDWVENVRTDDNRYAEIVHFTDEASYTAFMMKYV